MRGVGGVIASEDPAADFEHRDEVRGIQLGQPVALLFRQGTWPGKLELKGSLARRRFWLLQHWR